MVAYAPNAWFKFLIFAPFWKQSASRATIFLQCFDTDDWSFSPDMTYVDGTLNLTQHQRLGRQKSINRSKSKPEVEFQYDDRLFTEPEVVTSQPWIEMSKFGMQRDVDLLKRVPSLQKPLTYSCMDAILQSRYDVINPPLALFLLGERVAEWLSKRSRVSSDGLFLNIYL